MYALRLINAAYQHELHCVERRILLATPRVIRFGIVRRQRNAQVPADSSAFRPPLRGRSPSQRNNVWLAKPTRRSDSDHLDCVYLMGGTPALPDVVALGGVPGAFDGDTPPLIGATIPPGPLPPAAADPMPPPVLDPAVLPVVPAVPEPPGAPEPCAKAPVTPIKRTEAAATAMIALRIISSLSLFPLKRTRRAMFGSSYVDRSPEMRVRFAWAVEAGTSYTSCSTSA